MGSRDQYRSKIMEPFRDTKKKSEEPLQTPREIQEAMAEFLENHPGGIRPKNRRKKDKKKVLNFGTVHSDGELIIKTSQPDKNIQHSNKYMGPSERYNKHKKSNAELTGISR